jgi:hypothetical protein
MSSIAREDYIHYAWPAPKLTRHKRLTQLIADSFVGGNESGFVITHSRHRGA